MNNSLGFKSFHPLVNFLYFALILTFSMCLMEPVILVLSFVFALSYRIYLDKKTAFSLLFKFIIPVLLLTAIINPLFNHKGMTILAYFPSGNPLTLESIIYGIFSALMLSSTLLWFSSFSLIMTSDKFIYLFGRIIPALSLILSMILSFLPKFKRQLNLVREGQKAMGQEPSKGIIKSCKRGIKELSILLTWSLENAIDTADSMKSRGYGLPNRSSFSIYTLDTRDKNALVGILFLGIFAISLWVKGVFSSIYFPIFKLNNYNSFTILGIISLTALMSVPLVFSLMEDKKWKLLKSTI